MPSGGSGLVDSTAKGGRFAARGTVVVVVVVGADGEGEGTPAIGVVVVVVLSFLVSSCAATPVRAVPAAVIARIVGAPSAPAANPAGIDGNTATVALGTNGATIFFLHSSAERTTVGPYSAVCPVFAAWSRPST